ncbi:MAG: hypothetical protein Q4D04_13550 [Clostridia bacterium]|nr:hypothetical protein [Clostridia bacterium]
MANIRYENFILENKLKEQLDTKLSMLDFVTVDSELSANAGMTKKVNVYAATGRAEDVAEGEGNTQSIEMSYTQKEYIVGTTQARFIYTDEDAMTDPYLVDAGVQKMTEAHVNALNAKVNNEYWNASRYKAYTKGTDTVNFDMFVDAIALLNKERDEDAALFALCNAKMKAVLRKGLKDDLKYVEGYSRTGYIGHICGIPITIDNGIPDDCVVIASKNAVKYFYKKGMEVEQDRDQNLRKNIVYSRRVGLVAFVDESECAIIAPSTTAPTITTASIAAGSDRAFAGACASGARVEVLVNGVKAGEATVSGTSWSYTIPTATAGEVYSVVQYVKGYASAANASASNKTVS